MAKAYIEYTTGENFNCKPAQPPTESFSFAECLICDGVFGSFTNVLNGTTTYEWIEIFKYTYNWKMYKKAKRNARRR